MKIPPFWVKASYSDSDKKSKTESVLACGWSFTSLADAGDKALSRAKRIFEIISQGEKPNCYEDYLDRPVKEEIIETITREGQTIGIITRNRYGSLVLNTADIAFVDVDIPRVRPAGFIEGIIWMFSSKRHKQQQAAEAQTLQCVENWARQNPMRSFYLYRTCAGFRLLFVDDFYAPLSERTMAMMNELGTDSLYKKLTQKQDSFRARLTPKPWRCGCRRPPSGYPWLDSSEEQAYRQWEQTYKRAITGYKTCDFVGKYGQSVPHPAIQMIIDVHDRWVCGTPGQLLA